MTHGSSEGGALALAADLLDALSGSAEESLVSAALCRADHTQRGGGCQLLLSARLPQGTDA